MPSKKQRKNQKIIAKASKPDPRFTSVSYDPKFVQPSHKITKVKIDKRFASMMTDPEFQVGSTVDRYGRTGKAIQNKKGQKQKNNQLSDYYYMQKQQEEHSPQIEDNNLQEEISNEQEQQYNRISKWMENYNQESSEEDEYDENQLLEDSDGIWSDDEQNVVKGENVQATNRLALCNYDWMNINAKDLMILFNSFKPDTGSIKSVKVYYSEYGKQKLEEQEQVGPSGIWNENEEGIEEEIEGSKKFKKKTWKQLLMGSQDERKAQAFNDKKLRKYEMDRLKYFYAVIQCDSKSTADEIYKECDGNQFESSNLLFDLRFIPSQLVIPEELKKQECNDLPMNGEVKNFINRAVGHSKIGLTWEDPQLSNIAGLKKKNWGKMTDEQLEKIDWGMYLNEDDIKNQENQNKLMKRINKQGSDQKVQPDVDDWRKQCNKSYRKKSNRADDIQITFETGFGSINKANQNSQEKNGESLKHQIKTRKERWLKKKQEKLANRNREEDAHDPRANKQKLGLLVNPQSSKKMSDFSYNPNDDRFKAVFTNPMYSIDMTNPKFDHRKTGEVFKEVVKRNKNKEK